jgi:hypothetical protein
MWLLVSFIAVVTPNGGLNRPPKGDLCRGDSARPTESSIVFLFAPNGDSDNHTYSAIENTAQEKLNYVATEYSNQAEPSDVESTQQKTMLLLTSSHTHAPKPLRINTATRLPYPDNFRSTVSVFVPGQDKVGAPANSQRPLSPGETLLYRRSV